MCLATTTAITTQNINYAATTRNSCFANRDCDCAVDSGQHSRGPAEPLFECVRLDSQFGGQSDGNAEEYFAHPLNQDNI